MRGRRGAASRFMRARFRRTGRRRGCASRLRRAFGRGFRSWFGRRGCRGGRRLGLGRRGFRSRGVRGATLGFELGLARGFAGAFSFAAYLVEARGFQRALAGAQLLGGQVQIGAAGGRARRRRAGGARRGRLGVEHRALFGRRRTAQGAGRRRVDPSPLGLHHHRLGTPVAEALLHRSGAHRAAGAGLQRQGRAATGVSAILIVVRVAHPLALLKSPNPGWAGAPLRANP